jgi:protocatechuate 3,4-dioxygenase beta subunit
MNPSSCVIRRTLLVLSFVVLTGTAHAQFRASLRGTVTDPTGAAVVGATVTLIDTDTNQKLVSITDANGIYQFNALPPAPYKLTVEKTGFTTKVGARFSF